MNNETIMVDEYHHRSKHSLQKYAPGPDSLDWDTQPDPFRRFDGSPRFSLPLPAKNLLVDFNDIYEQQRITPAILDQNTLGALFELSMGLSAWKVYGSDRWALRVNPSSGNLHPTEAYLVFAGTNIIPAGVYHYHSHDHCLEQRCNLKSHSDALTMQLDNNRFLIGFSSIHWREAWKYGERAYRYCQHDVGHAIAAVRYAAAVLGWQVRLLDHCSDQQIASLLGLNRSDDFFNSETEAADLLLLVTTSNNTEYPEINSLIEIASQAEWKGQANCLSPDNRMHWDVIEQIAASCETPQTEPQEWTPPNHPMITQCDTDFDASSIIRQRRSAQAFDPQAELPLSKLYRMLDTLLPRKHTAPFDALPWQPRIHLVLYVHRVEGLRPGLYVLPRSEAGELLLKQNLREQFDWSRPPICPESLPFFNLVNANSQNAARTVSCHQAIASDGAFSVSMLAEFHDTVTDTPWQYKKLFWEAGLIGQDLYLEAEAAGVRATGIGCYFDDAVHEILGINNDLLQVIYHFTVGTPLMDTRLISLPPYGHLNTSK
jgi:SagB-type dehydrogenase family enzyme